MLCAITLGDEINRQGDRREQTDQWKGLASPICTLADQLQGRDTNKWGQARVQVYGEADKPCGSRDIISPLSGFQDSEKVYANITSRIQRTGLPVLCYTPN